MAEKRLLGEPSKRSKACFEGFDGDPGGASAESHDRLEEADHANPRHCVRNRAFHHRSRHIRRPDTLLGLEVAKELIVMAALFERREAQLLVELRRFRSLG